ncbi:MAG: sugar isomerase [Bacteroidota bacterium]
MRIEPGQIDQINQANQAAHRRRFDFLANELTAEGRDVDAILAALEAFQVAIPSWALGTGGTRFGRFSGAGEPATLEQKIADVGILHALTRSADAISLHIPWDIPQDPTATREWAASFGLHFDAVNSNTFQDQPGQPHSYKFGSLSHVDPAVRAQAVEHNQAVIRYGEALGSKSITVWLADGSSFPGQHSFRRAYADTLASLREVYTTLPTDWSMFVEYKPYEPNFYSMVIPDWGTSLLLCQALGPQAHCLVDLGHHLPNTNIEQIVAILFSQGRLGGFHFNDSKYGDDDLSVGAIKPYQLFLIFQELVYGMQHNQAGNPPLAWMIDASHNLKDPLEDLLQSLDAILCAYAQALIVDQEALTEAQSTCDVARAQDLLQAAYRTDMRALVAEARRRAGGSLDPMATYRQLDIRSQLVASRGRDTVATGL